MRNVLHVIPSRFWGGGQQYIYELADEYQKHQKGNVFFVGKNIDVFCQKYSQLGIYRSLPFKSLLDIYTMFCLARIVRKDKIEIIHVHKFKDALIVALAMNIFMLGKTKLFMTRHLVEKGRFSILYRWLYTNINAVIFVSDTVRREFYSNASEHVNLRDVVIYNSIRPKREIAPPIADLREEYHIPENFVLVGFTGRVVKEKGVEVLIQALNYLRHNNVIVLIAGAYTKEYLASLEELMEQYNLKDRIYFLNFIENIPEFAAQIDIAVLPSIVPEACPLTVLEYMALGKPLIASNNGAQTDLIKNGTDGILVAPNDSEGIAAIIDDLIEDPEKCIQLGINARKRSSEFNYEQFFHQVLETYHSY